ncbi:MAG: tetratricopeptide repeat protein [Planctomycetota bacterium JB042]
MVRSARLRPSRGAFCSLVLLAAASSCRDEPAAATAEAPSEDEAVRSPYFERVQDDIQQLLRLVRMQPDNPSLRLDLGRKFLEGGMPAIAERHLCHALRIDPTLVEARVLMARNFYERQQVEKAVRLLLDGIDLGEAASLHALLATIELARPDGDRARAVESLDRALELDSRCVDAAYERGRIAASEGEEEKAVRLFERVVALDPTHLGATFNLAQLARRAGDVERASALLATHRRLSALEDLGQLDDPESVAAYVALAEMWIDGGAVEDGLGELRAGVARHPEKPILRVRLAMALVRLGRHAEVREVYELALKEIPREPMLMNQYAWYLATRGGTAGDRQRALRLAEKAVHLTKGADANVLDTLAEARAASGDSEGALAAIDAALRLRPGDAGLERRRFRFAHLAKGGE